MQPGDQPWGLDTRHLEALSAIARTRSISRAAEELGYGQSAVSQQLASMERIIGERLVDRGTGPRPVTLTAAGQVLLPHAERILDRLRTARSDLERLRTGTSGSLRIGSFQSAGARLLPQILATYRSEWPEIAVSIHNGDDWTELAHLVRDATLDVAFMEESALEPGLAHLQLLIDRYVVLVPPRHRLAGHAKLSLAELAGEDLIADQERNSCTARCERTMRDAGFEPRVVFRTDDNPTRQRLVDAGLGCALAPDLTVERGLPNGGVVVPIEEDLSRTLCIAWSAERTPSPALERFIETARSSIPSGAAASDTD